MFSTVAWDYYEKRGEYIRLRTTNFVVQSNCPLRLK